MSAGLHSGEVNEIAVAVLQNNILGTSFHPELTSDYRWHTYFIKLVKDSISSITPPIYISPPREKENVSPSWVVV